MDHLHQFWACTGAMLGVIKIVFKKINLRWQHGMAQPQEYRACSKYTNKYKFAETKSNVIYSSANKITLSKKNYINTNVSSIIMNQDNLLNSNSSTLIDDKTNEHFTIRKSFNPQGTLLQRQKTWHQPP